MYNWLYLDIPSSTACAYIDAVTVGRGGVELEAEML